MSSLYDYNINYGNKDFAGITNEMWNGYTPAEKAGIFDSFNNGLAGSNAGGSTGFGGGFLDAFTNDNGGFDLGGSINTIKQIGGLAEGLQGLFGKNPEFEQTKKIQDANLANMERMSDNSVNAYNNQLARGAGGRSKAHGGVDPLTRAV